MSAVIPHDPTHHARLSYTCWDEHWHLLDIPEPTVVLVSSTVSQGLTCSTPNEAEDMFWQGVASSILAHHQRIVSIAWPQAGVEAAVLIDPGTGLYHLASRDGHAAGARCFPHEAEARTAWMDVVRVLIADRFIAWTVWTSDTGRWWATRRTPLSEDEVLAGVPRTLHKTTPLELVDALESK